jgi:hypothetical protein
MALSRGVTQRRVRTLRGRRRGPPAIEVGRGARSVASVRLLWAATGAYDAALVAVLASSTLVMAGFWFAAAQTNP